jgi:hypothetical protein
MEPEARVVLSIDEEAYMADQKGLRAASRLKATTVYMLDLPELGYRIQKARINRRYPTAAAMKRALDDWCSAHGMPSLSIGMVHRLETGKRPLSADEILMFEEVLKPEGGPAYFLPKIGESEPDCQPGD